MISDETRSFRTTMTIINSDISKRRRCENLTLVFKRRVCLYHRYRIITWSMRLQVRVPQQAISASSGTKTPLPRPVTRPGHLSSKLLPPFFPRKQKIILTKKNSTLVFSLLTQYSICSGTREKKEKTSRWILVRGFGQSDRGRPWKLFGE